MKTFREYLMEAEKEKGAYASLKLDVRSQEKIANWLEEHEIPGDLEKPKNYHVTVAYSKKPIPDLKSYEPDLPITVSIKGWHIFPTQDDGSCLVLDVDDPKLQKIFKHIMSMGASWDFPEFKPHITVVPKGFKGPKPKNHPKFKIKFDEFKVEDLDD